MFRTSLAELTADPAALTGRVLVDFDHTLFGGNSTELFIAHSRPRFLVACADVLIRRCAPIPRRLSSAGLMTHLHLDQRRACPCLVGKHVFAA